jgi:hypothetical protein
MLIEFVSPVTLTRASAGAAQQPKHGHQRPDGRRARQTRQQNGTSPTPLSVIESPGRLDQAPHPPSRAAALRWRLARPTCAKPHARLGTRRAPPTGRAPTSVVTDLDREVLQRARERAPRARASACGSRGPRGRASNETRTAHDPSPLLPWTKESARRLAPDSRSGRGGGVRGQESAPASLSQSSKRSSQLRSRRLVLR